MAVHILDKETGLCSYVEASGFQQRIQQDEKLGKRSRSKCTKAAALKLRKSESVFPRWKK